MIIGVILLLIAEAMVLRSITVGIWAAIFFLGNAVYFPFCEERGLEDRFGDPYLEYKSNVPRWIPQLEGWESGEPPRA